MLPLYAARIEELRPGDFVKVDCAACHDLKDRLRCRGCGRKGRAVVSVKWRGQGQ